MLDPTIDLVEVIVHAADQIARVSTPVLAVSMAGLTDGGEYDVTLSFGNAAGHARFDGDESDGDSFRRSSEVQEQKLGGGGRSSFFRRSSEVREVGR